MEPFEDWVTVHQDEGEGHTRTELVVNAAQRLFKFTPGWEREAHQDGASPIPTILMPRVAREIGAKNCII